MTRLWRLIDRYLSIAVLKAMLVVLLAFAGLNAVFQLVEELRQTHVGYGFREAVVYVVLTQPRRIYELIPYVVFLGTLIGLGQMANQNEITVLRASGVSKARLFGSAAIPAFAALLIALAFGEYLAPWGEETAEGYKAQARQSSSTIRFWGGHWYREGGMFMEVGAMDANGKLIGVRQYFLDQDRHLKIAREAATAVYVAEEKAWSLTNVNETLIEESGTSSRHVDEVRWPSEATPELLGIRVLLGPSNLSIRGLAMQIAYMDREDLDASRYRLAYWSKVLQPGAILGLSLLALCFILGPLREVSMGTRLAVGTLTGLAFKYLEDIFGPMSMVYRLPAAAAVAAPILICWAVAFWMLRRAR
ncbi:MAG TPA: LPS export ABC transporter permease LptG [Pseudomonadales bacterium]|nr:LPS export ABC transporter permease LptG [Pseudomonadales bacterium]